MANAVELECAACGAEGSIEDFYPKGHARCPKCKSRGHFIMRSIEAKK